MGKKTKLKKKPNGSVSANGKHSQKTSKLNLSIPADTSTGISNEKSSTSAKKSKSKLGTKVFDSGIELQAYPPKISFKKSF